MEKEFLNKIIKFSRSKFRKFEDQEDFQSWACIKLLSGRKTTLKNLYVDFMRENFGDVRFEYGRLKSKAKATSRQFDESDILEKNGSNLDPDEQKDLFEDLKKLVGNERIVILLYVYWELTFMEIGFVMGYTEQRVHQIVTVVQERLSKTHNRFRINKLLN